VIQISAFKTVTNFIAWNVKTKRLAGLASIVSLAMYLLIPRKLIFKKLDSSTDSCVETCKTPMNCFMCEKEGTCDVCDDGYVRNLLISNNYYERI
jgi:hypothetical protein